VRLLILIQDYRAERFRLGDLHGPLTQHSNPPRYRVPSQGLSFKQWGFTIVANPGIDLPSDIQKGYQFSRANAPSFNHSGLKRLAVIHLGIEKEHHGHRGPLTR
jgi:hypothetical protein